MSGSIALVGFGLDSVVESLSGLILIWRLKKHNRATPDREEASEKRAQALVGFTFFITPRLTLQAYVQPFLAVGEYDRFKELASPGTSDYNIYENTGSISFAGNVYSIDPDGPGEASPFSFYNPDFNFKSLRGTIVLRWEYHPGSLIYFVWTQNKQDYSHPGDLRFGRDLGDLFTSPGDNIFLLKMTYRWNM